jgi:iron complex outermembrane receptor protein
MNVFGHKRSCLFTVVQFLVFSILRSQVTFTGTVQLPGGEGLPGAVIYFPDLRAGGITGSDGTFKVEHLPRVTTLVQIKLTGYKTMLRNVDLSSSQQQIFKMEESVIEENEVVVTGVSEAAEVKKNPVPMVMVDSKYLEQSGGTNAIDALSKVPGLNAISTGPNVSKPVIRGLAFNRVLTLFDGIRQEGQQWGEEHGVEIDQFLISRVEIIKGPASLTYGSDALGGVVNLLPSDPAPGGMIKGNVLLNYQSNNGLKATSLVLDGNRKGYIFGGRISLKEAMDFQNNADGRVYNTGFKEKDFYAYLGTNRRWGYSHLGFTLYDNLQEIPDGGRDSVSRKFTKQINESGTRREIVSEEELNSYNTSAIHQRIEHMRINSVNKIIAGKGKIGLRFGYQNSRRREYAHPLAPTLPGLYLKMQTGTYDVKYQLPAWKKTESSLGVNGMFQKNVAGEGTDFVIPDYTLFDLAPFVYVRKNFGKVDLAGGARFDTRSLAYDALYVTRDPFSGFDKRVADTSARRLFDPGKNHFSGWSSSVGATFNISEKTAVKANIARGYRAPSITELSARGVHPGSGFQQLGDKNLRPESNLQGDLGLFFDNEHISAAAECFVNLIDNYIFNHRLLTLSGVDSVYYEDGETYPVYEFVQTNAQLMGAEARFDIHPHPLDWLHFENAVSLVYGNNAGKGNASVTAGNKYLPFIPPLHTNSELRAEFRKKRGRFSAIHLKLGFQYFAAQNRIFMEGNTETKTSSYYLMDLGAGADIKDKKDRTRCSFVITVTNLLNEVYQSNMNRLKYLDSYPNNTTGRSGIYGMGRNIGFRFVFPVVFSQQ